MYDDRRETFSIKDIFLQLLFIILLVFILIWLFPTKGYLEKKLDGIESSMDEKLQPLYTRLFTDNIITMKDAAKSYFTTPRLPQNVGDTVKMTLGEMYDKGLLLELVDSNNNACSPTKSYIELTKMEDEYQMKVTLSCSDKEAYVIEYMGCYDYCNGKLCTKEENRTNQIKITNPTPTPTPSEPAKKYKYQYVLYEGGTCSKYGSWTEWTTNKIEENSNTKVETKTEKVLDHYEQVYKVVDTKYVDQDYYEDVYYGYSTRTIKRTTVYNYTTTTTNTILSYATRTIKKTTVYDYTYTTTTTGTTGGTTTWVDAGTQEFTSARSSNDTTRYTLISTRQEMDCNNACRYVNYYVYKVEKAQTTAGTPVTTTTKSCPSGTTDNGSGCVATEYVTENYCPTGTDTGSGCQVSSSSTSCAQGTDIGTGCQVVTYTKENYCSSNGTDTGSGCVVKVKKTKKVAELVYGYVDGDPVYKDVTYYRSATRTCKDATVDYKWSESDNDADLKSKGYTLTGVTEEIK
ncbi:MAG: hypothetical protein IJ565_00315 [Bacilli bacterium]|nr:hypothetical protein [Bacilli bacterium]